LGARCVQLQSLLALGWPASGNELSRKPGGGSRPAIHSLQVDMNFGEIDRSVLTFMRRWGILALRISLALIFIWFGVLKPLGLSAAAPLVVATVRWLPLFDGEVWVSIIGWWEVAIGITFLFQKTIRIAIGLLALQMVGTFMPLILLPAVTFQAGHVPYGPTMEGQYIIKNLLIISAALVVGGTVRRSDEAA
jgi:uncharacterized membrane protein YkgB